MRALGCGVAFACFSAPAAGQEVVVTAERLAPEAERPASLAVLTAGDLIGLAAQTPGEALNRLPGVSVQNNSGVENLPAIRSPVLIGGQSAGSFLILQDGVPVRAPGFANVNQLWEAGLDFAEQVVVLRGPGSSLYGSNAVHGVVDVRSPDPGSSGQGCRRALAEASAGQSGRAQARLLLFGRAGALREAPCGERGAPGSQGGPASGQALRGVAGLSIEHDQGWRAQSGLDRQAALLGVSSALPGGRWEIAGRLSMQNLNQETAGFIEGPNAYDDRATARTNPVPEAYRDAVVVRAQARLVRRGPDLELRLVPFARLVEADLNLSFFPSRAQERTSQVGGGVQASAAIQAFDGLGLLIGADIDLTRGALLEVQQRPTLGTFPQGVHYDYVVDMRALGVYAQGEWAVRPAWLITAGVRAEHMAYAYDNRAADGDVGRFRRPADRDDAFEGLSPRLAVSRRLGEGLVFVNLTQGLRPPQITDLYSLQTRQTPGEQGMERTGSAEVGWRGALAGARAEAVGYLMEKSDTAFRGSDGFTVTGGRTRHHGVEVSGLVPLGEAWSLAGWAAYSRHTYRFTSPADGIADGADIDTAPRWLGNLQLRWEPQANLWVELEWAHVGRYYTNPANTRSYTGHDLFALRAAWRPEGQGAEVFGVVRNLTDTGYADRADFAFGADRYFPGAPRSVTLGVRRAL